MTKPQVLAEKFRSSWEKIQHHPEKAPRCFIGFDGFTDEIISAVDERDGVDSYKPFTSIKQLGERIIKAAGKSCNIELVVQRTKLGGNAPILANALLEGGHRITFVGPIGYPGQIEPLFQNMASRCERVVTLGPSAHTDAIEFDDGKILLGKLSPLAEINYELIANSLGKKGLIQALDRADLLIFANWTMLLTMTDIWRHLYREVIPHLKPKKRWVFIDLADPAKRTDEDIRDAIDALVQLNESLQVVLGLNEAEALRVASVIGCHAQGGSEQNIKKTAESIQKKLGLFRVVIHATKFAVSADSRTTEIAHGIYTKHPLITTGGGDNFNAGYCNALLYGCDAEQALLSGVATSGFYVSQGKSPTMPELIELLIHWE